MMARDPPRRRSLESTRRWRRERRDTTQLPRTPDQHIPVSIPYYDGPHDGPSRAPQDARPRALSNSSTSSSTSSSLLNISRPSKSGFAQFFSPKAHIQRRRVKKKRKFLGFGNASSSSVSSDLAYGKGYIRRRGSRSFSPPSGRKPRRDGEELGRPVPPRAQTDEEIIALGKKFAAIAKHQNTQDLKNSGRTRPSAILGAAAAIHQMHRMSSGKLDQRGLGSSKPHRYSSSDDSEWESASEDESLSESSSDSGLVYGSATNLPSTSSQPTGFGAGGRHNLEPDFHRPVHRKPSLVDPHLFGPVNSLRGFVQTPCGFDSVQPTPSNEAGPVPGIPSFDKQPMQHVFPVPTSDPARFDAARGSVVSVNPDRPSQSRPAPVPLQQPKPIVPVSNRVFEAVDEGNDPYVKRTSSGKLLVGAVATALAGATVGKALSYNDKDHNEREKLREDERRRDDRREPAKLSREDRRRARDENREYEREQRRREHEQRASDSKRDYDRDDDRDHDRERRYRDKHETKGYRSRADELDDYYRRYQEKPAEEQYYDKKGKRPESHRETPKDVREFDGYHRRTGSEYPSESGLDHYYDAKGKRPESYSEAPKDVRPTEFDGYRRITDPDHPSEAGPIDPFQFQVADDAFQTPTFQTPKRPLTPNVVFVEREPDFSKPINMDLFPTERLSRKDSYERDVRAAQEAHDAKYGGTKPISAAAVAAAVTASVAEGRMRRNTGAGGDREVDPIQEKIDKQWREQERLRKAEEEEKRSRSNSPDPSVVDQWRWAKSPKHETTQIEPVVIVEPAESSRKEPHKSPYDAPNADVRIDNVLEHPVEIRRFQAPRGTGFLTQGEDNFTFKSRDPSAERERPLLNLVRPTPTPSPMPERQTVREQAPRDRPVVTKIETSQTNTENPAEPRGDVTPATPRTVTWGENSTKHYIVESPIKEDDPWSGPKIIEPAESKPRLGRKSGWGAITAAVAGVGAVAATASAVSDSSSSKRSQRPNIDNKASSPVDDFYNSPPVPGPKPSNPASRNMPGSFDEDPMFTANIAAGLEGSGFDPNIILDDAKFYKRTSPPRTDDAGPTEVWDRAFVLGEIQDSSETENDIATNTSDIYSKLAKKDKRRSEKYPKSETYEDTIAESANPDTPRSTASDSPLSSKISRKEQKRRDKAAAKEAAEQAEVPQNIKPAREVSPPREEKDEGSSKKKSRKSKKAVVVQEDLSPQRDASNKDGTTMKEARDAPIPWADVWSTSAREGRSKRTEPLEDFDQPPTSSQALRDQITVIEDESPRGKRPDDKPEIVEEPDVWAAWADELPDVSVKSSTDRQTGATHVDVVPTAASERGISSERSIKDSQSDISPHSPNAWNVLASRMALPDNGQQFVGPAVTSKSKDLEDVTKKSKKDKKKEKEKRNPLHFDSPSRSASARERSLSPSKRRSLDDVETVTATQGPFDQNLPQVDREWEAGSTSWPSQTVSVPDTQSENWRSQADDISFVTLMDEPSFIDEGRPSSRGRDRRRILDADDKASDSVAPSTVASFQTVAESFPASDLTRETTVVTEEDFDDTPKKKSKKKKSKRDSGAHDPPSRAESVDTISSPRTIVDSVSDVRSGRDGADEKESSTPKKSKKKKSSRHESDKYEDSPSRPASRADDPSVTPSSKKSKRRSEVTEESPSRRPRSAGGSEVSSHFRKSKRDVYLDSPARSVTFSELDSPDHDRRSKKEKRRSYPGTLASLEAPERSLDSFNFVDDDVSSVVSDPSHYANNDDSRPTMSASISDLRDLKGSKIDKDPKEKRSSGGFGFFDRFKSSIGLADEKEKARKSEEDKKSFLDNAGTLGAGVGLTGSAMGLASRRFRLNAFYSFKDQEALSSPTERQPAPAPPQQDIFDPEIVQREIRPAIDPQFGDLLPLPPSNPGSPDPEIDDLPALPDSRPDTPENERQLRRDLAQHTRKRSGIETPMKTPLKPHSPSHSAIPLLFRLPPSSPGLMRASPAASPITTSTPEASGSVTKSRPRPTSWQATKEFKPLYLVEKTSLSNKHDDELIPAELPELPPSEPSEPSSRGSPASQLSIDDYEDTPLHWMPPLSLDTTFQHTAFEDEPDALLGSGDSTPKAEFPSRTFDDAVREAAETPSESDVYESAFASPQLPPASAFDEPDWSQFHPSPVETTNEDKNGKLPLLHPGAEQQETISPPSGEKSSTARATDREALPTDEIRHVKYENLSKFGALAAAAAGGAAAYAALHRGEESASASDEFFSTNNSPSKVDFSDNWNDVPSETIEQLSNVKGPKSQDHAAPLDTTALPVDESRALESKDLAAASDEYAASIPLPEEAEPLDSKEENATQDDFETLEPLLSDMHPVLNSADISQDPSATRVVKEEVSSDVVAPQFTDPLDYKQELVAPEENEKSIAQPTAETEYAVPVAISESMPEAEAPPEKLSKKAKKKKKQQEKAQAQARQEAQVQGENSDRDLVDVPAEPIVSVDENKIKSEPSMSAEAESVSVPELVIAEPEPFIEDRQAPEQPASLERSIESELPAAPELAPLVADVPAAVPETLTAPVEEAQPPVGTLEEPATPVKLSNKEKKRRKKAEAEAKALEAEALKDQSQQADVSEAVKQVPTSAVEPEAQPLSEATEQIPEPVSVQVDATSSEPAVAAHLLEEPQVDEASKDITELVSAMEPELATEEPKELASEPAEPAKPDVVKEEATSAEPPLLIEDEPTAEPVKLSKRERRRLKKLEEEAAANKTDSVLPLSDAPLVETSLPVDTAVAAAEEPVGKPAHDAQGPAVTEPAAEPTEVSREPEVVQDPSAALPETAVISPSEEPTVSETQIPKPPIDQPTTEPEVLHPIINETAQSSEQQTPAQDPAQPSADLADPEPAIEDVAGESKKSKKKKKKGTNVAELDEPDEPKQVVDSEVTGEPAESAVASEDQVPEPQPEKTSPLETPDLEPVPSQRETPIESVAESPSTIDPPAHSEPEAVAQSSRQVDVKESKQASTGQQKKKSGFFSFLTGALAGAALPAAAKSVSRDHDNDDASRSLEPQSTEQSTEQSHAQDTSPPQEDLDAQSDVAPAQLEVAAANDRSPEAIAEDEEYGSLAAKKEKRGKLKVKDRKRFEELQEKIDRRVAESEAAQKLQETELAEPAVSTEQPQVQGETTEPVEAEVVPLLKDMPLEDIPVEKSSDVTAQTPEMSVPKVPAEVAHLESTLNEQNPAESTPETSSDNKTDLTENAPLIEQEQQLKEPVASTTEHVSEPQPAITLSENQPIVAEETDETPAAPREKAADIQEASVPVPESPSDKKSKKKKKKRKNTIESEAENSSPVMASEEAQDHVALALESVTPETSESILVDNTIAPVPEARALEVYSVTEAAELPQIEGTPKDDGDTILSIEPSSTSAGELIDPKVDEQNVVLKATPLVEEPLQTESVAAEVENAGSGEQPRSIEAEPVIAEQSHDVASSELTPAARETMRLFTADTGAADVSVGDAPSPVAEVEDSGKKSKKDKKKKKKRSSTQLDELVFEETIASSQPEESRSNLQEPEPILSAEPEMTMQQGEPAPATEPETTEVQSNPDSPARDVETFPAEAMKEEPLNIEESLTGDSATAQQPAVEPLVTSTSDAVNDLRQTEPVAVDVGNADQSLASKDLTDEPPQTPKSKKNKKKKRASQIEDASRAEPTANDASSSTNEAGDVSLEPTPAEAGLAAAPTAQSSTEAVEPTEPGQDEPARTSQDLPELPNVISSDATATKTADDKENRRTVAFVESPEEFVIDAAAPVTPALDQTKDEVVPDENQQTPTELSISKTSEVIEDPSTSTAHTSEPHDNEPQHPLVQAPEAVTLAEPIKEAEVENSLPGDLVADVETKPGEVDEQPLPSTDDLVVSTEAQTPELASNQEQASLPTPADDETAVSKKKSKKDKKKKRQFVSEAIEPETASATALADSILQEATSVDAVPESQTGNTDNVALAESAPVAEGAFASVQNDRSTELVSPPEHIERAADVTEPFSADAEVKAPAGDLDPLEPRQEPAAEPVILPAADTADSIEVNQPETATDWADKGQEELAHTQPAQEAEATGSKKSKKKKKRASQVIEAESSTAPSEEVSVVDVTAETTSNSNDAKTLEPSSLTEEPTETLDLPVEDISAAVASTGEDSAVVEFGDPSLEPGNGQSAAHEPVYEPADIVTETDAPADKPQTDIPSAFPQQQETARNISNIETESPENAVTLSRKDKKKKKKKNSSISSEDVQPSNEDLAAPEQRAAVPEGEPAIDASASSAPLESSEMPEVQELSKDEPPTEEPLIPEAPVSRDVGSTQAPMTETVLSTVSFETVATETGDVVETAQDVPLPTLNPLDVQDEHSIDPVPEAIDESVSSQPAATKKSKKDEKKDSISKVDLQPSDERLAEPTEGSTSRQAEATEVVDVEPSLMPEPVPSISEPVSSQQLPITLKTTEPGFSSPQDQDPSILSSLPSQPEPAPPVPEESNQEEAPIDPAVVAEIAAEEEELAALQAKKDKNGKLKGGSKKRYAELTKKAQERAESQPAVEPGISADVVPETSSDLLSMPEIQAEQALSDQLPIETAAASSETHVPEVVQANAEALPKDRKQETNGEVPQQLPASVAQKGHAQSTLDIAELPAEVVQPEQPHEPATEVKEELGDQTIQEEPLQKSVDESSTKAEETLVISQEPRPGSSNLAREAPREAEDIIGQTADKSTDEPPRDATRVPANPDIIDISTKDDSPPAEMSKDQSEDPFSPRKSRKKKNKKSQDISVDELSQRQVETSVTEPIAVEAAPKTVDEAKVELFDTPVDTAPAVVPHTEAEVVVHEPVEQVAPITTEEPQISEIPPKEAESAPSEEAAILAEKEELAALMAKKEKKGKLKRKDKERFEELTENSRRRKAKDTPAEAVEQADVEDQQRKDDDAQETPGPEAQTSAADILPAVTATAPEEDSTQPVPEEDVEKKDLPLDQPTEEQEPPLEAMTTVPPKESQGNNATATTSPLERYEPSSELDPQIAAEEEALADLLEKKQKNGKLKGKDKKRFEELTDNAEHRALERATENAEQPQVSETERAVAPDSVLREELPSNQDETLEVKNFEEVSYPKAELESQPLNMVQEAPHASIDPRTDSTPEQDSKQVTAEPVEQPIVPSMTDAEVEEFDRLSAKKETTGKLKAKERRRLEELAQMAEARQPAQQDAVGEQAHSSATAEMETVPEPIPEEEASSMRELPAVSDQSDVHVEELQSTEIEPSTAAEMEELEMLKAKLDAKGKLKSKEKKRLEDLVQKSEARRATELSVEQPEVPIVTTPEPETVPAQAQEEDAIYPIETPHVPTESVAKIDEPQSSGVNPFIPAEDEELAALKARLFAKSKPKRKAEKPLEESTVEAEHAVEQPEAVQDFQLTMQALPSQDNPENAASPAKAQPSSQERVPSDVLTERSGDLGVEEPSTQLGETIPLATDQYASTEVQEEPAQMSSSAQDEPKKGLEATNEDDALGSTSQVEKAEPPTLMAEDVTTSTKDLPTSKQGVQSFSAILNAVRLAEEQELAKLTAKKSQTGKLKGKDKKRFEELTEKASRRSTSQTPPQITEGTAENLAQGLHQDKEQNRPETAEPEILEQATPEQTSDATEPLLVESHSSAELSEDPALMQDAQDTDLPIPQQDQERNVESSVVATKAADIPLPTDDAELSILESESQLEKGKEEDISLQGPETITHVNDEQVVPETSDGPLALRAESDVPLFEREAAVAPPVPANTADVETPAESVGVIQDVSHKPEIVHVAKDHELVAEEEELAALQAKKDMKGKLKGKDKRRFDELKAKADERAKAEAATSVEMADDNTAPTFNPALSSDIVSEATPDTVDQTPEATTRVISNASQEDFPAVPVLVEETTAIAEQETPAAKEHVPALQSIATEPLQESSEQPTFPPKQLSSNDQARASSDVESMVGLGISDSAQTIPAEVDESSTTVSSSKKQKKKKKKRQSQIGSGKITETSTEPEAEKMNVHPVLASALPLKSDEAPPMDISADKIEVQKATSTEAERSLPTTEVGAVDNNLHTLLSSADDQANREEAGDVDLAEDRASMQPVPLELQPIDQLLTETDKPIPQEQSNDAAFIQLTPSGQSLSTPLAKPVHADTGITDVEPASEVKPLIEPGSKEAAGIESRFNDVSQTESIEPTRTDEDRTPEPLRQDVTIEDKSAKILEAAGTPPVEQPATAIAQAQSWDWTNLESNVDAKMAVDERDDLTNKPAPAGDTAAQSHNLSRELEADSVPDQKESKRSKKKKKKSASVDEPAASQLARPEAGIADKESQNKTDSSESAVPQVSGGQEVPTLDPTTSAQLDAASFTTSVPVEVSGNVKVESANQPTEATMAVSDMPKSSSEERHMSVLNITATPEAPATLVPQQTEIPVNASILSTSSDPSMSVPLDVPTDAGNEAELAHKVALEAPSMTDSPPDAIRDGQFQRDGAKEEAAQVFEPADEQAHARKAVDIPTLDGAMDFDMQAPAMEAIEVQDNPATKELDVEDTSQQLDTQAVEDKELELGFPQHDATRGVEFVPPPALTFDLKPAQPSSHIEHVRPKEEPSPPPKKKRTRTVLFDDPNVRGDQLLNTEASLESLTSLVRESPGGLLPPIHRDGDAGQGESNTRPATSDAMPGEDTAMQAKNDVVVSQDTTEATGHDNGLPAITPARELAASYFDNQATKAAPFASEKTPKLHQKDAEPVTPFKDLAATYLESMTMTKEEETILPANHYDTNANLVQQSNETPSREVAADPLSSRFGASSKDIDTSTEASSSSKNMITTIGGAALGAAAATSLGTSSKKRNEKRKKAETRGIEDEDEEMLVDQGMISENIKPRHTRKSSIEDARSGVYGVEAQEKRSLDVDTRPQLQAEPQTGKTQEVMEEAESPVRGRGSRPNTRRARKAAKAEQETDQPDRYMPDWDYLDTSEEVDEQRRSWHKPEGDSNTQQSVNTPHTPALSKSRSIKDFGRVSTPTLPRVEEEVYEEPTRARKRQDRYEQDRDSGFAAGSPHPPRRSGGLGDEAQRDSGGLVVGDDKSKPSRKREGLSEFDEYGARLSRPSNADDKELATPAPTPQLDEKRSAKRPILGDSTPRLDTPTHSRRRSEDQRDEHRLYSPGEVEVYSTDPAKRRGPTSSSKASRYGELGQAAVVAPRSPRILEPHEQRSISEGMGRRPSPRLENTPPSMRRTASNSSLLRMRTPEPGTFRADSPSNQSIRSLRSSVRAHTPPLRRVDNRASGDLRAMSLGQQQGPGPGRSHSSLGTSHTRSHSRDEDNKADTNKGLPHPPTPAPPAGPAPAAEHRDQHKDQDKAASQTAAQTAALVTGVAAATVGAASPSSSTTTTAAAANGNNKPTSTPVANEGRVRSKDMADVYDGFGEGRIGSPRSPTRPHSMRRRQSMQVLELESRVEALIAENQHLQLQTFQAEQISARSAATKAERDAEIELLRASLESLQNEVTRLTQVNDGLQSANSLLALQHSEKYGHLESQHATVARELEEHRGAKNNYTTELQQKDAEIARLRKQLQATKEQIKEMQRQILASKPPDAEFLRLKDEDHFDQRCQQLCSHVQQWVLRFSKFSDMRACRLTNEINDEKIIDKLDNTVLDGTDVDDYLSDRVRRRDVFMSMTMNMIWEFVFTRYLFGMDREQRQKLKSVEKLLQEVGPLQAVRQWRAVTLTLLSKRPAFGDQRNQDTEAVVQAILQTLSMILPPPSNLENQIQSQLRRVVRDAVDLSIEMRTQRAEYMMLPPLQPEYDANGDLADTVKFNAALMNERSGGSTTNEELESQGAVVRFVLFPLVVKKGDDNGVGDDEIVVCPAQVLVARSRALRGTSAVGSDIGGVPLSRGATPLSRGPTPSNLGRSVLSVNMTDAQSEI